MDNTKEYIVCSAYKTKKSSPVCYQKSCLKHKSLTKNKLNELDDIYELRLGRYHVEIIQMFGKEIDEDTDGFYTSYGRWVDRKQAMEIALECGQVQKENLIMGWGLDSSDIFKQKESNE